MNTHSACCKSTLRAPSAETMLRALVRDDNPLHDLFSARVAPWECAEIDDRCTGDCGPARPVVDALTADFGMYDGADYGFCASIEVLP